MGTYNFINPLNLNMGMVTRQENMAILNADQGGEKNRNWNGGAFINKYGYNVMRMPKHPRSNGGYVPEHILVAEKKLGREITVREIVHHIDRNRLNNSPDNLRVMKRGEHHTLHKKGFKIPKLLGNKNGFKKGMIPWNKGRKLK